MANFRVKHVKHRPIDSRERLPTVNDAAGDKVFVYFGGDPSWRVISLSTVLEWAKRYTLYWAPTKRTS
jgi:hypothetical protein